MTDFVKTICMHENFYPEFIFHLLHTRSGIKRFHVWVYNNGSQLSFFETQQIFNGYWKIIDAPKVPDWIMELEREISDAIVEALKSHQLTDES